MTSKSSFFALTGTAAASAEDFDIRYLGAKTIAPLTDNNGNPLVNGALYFNLTTDTFWAWDGTAWVENATGGGAIDHGALTGLLDDDHTQYHTDARGDARYSLLAHTHSGLAPAGGATGEVLKKVSGTNYDYAWQADATGGGGGVTDHGALTGLADDDHPQYHNDARGDARYSVLAHTHTSAGVTDFTEAAQDSVGAMVDASLTYVDATPLLQRAALTGAITASAGSNATSLGSFTFAQLNAAVSDTDVSNVGHTHTLANVTDVTITATQLNTLDDGTNTVLHFHDADRVRSNHTGTQPSSTISDFNEAAQDAVGLMVDTSLTYVDATPLLQRAALTGAVTAAAGSNTTALGSFTLAQLNTAVSDADVANATHTHTLANVTDVTMTVANLNTLDDGVNTALHFHDADRARANHTGTQTASTISDFNSAADARIAAAVIDNLSDVVITTPTTNQVLKYNGTNWTNQADATGAGGLSDSDYGDVVVSGGATVFTVESAAGAFAFKGVLTPAQITANQNDYAPAGLSTATTLRLSSDNDSRTITGISGGAVGRVLTLENVGATDIILTHEDAGSVAANRIDNGGSATILTSKGTVTLQYDATLSRWYVIGVKGDDTSLVSLRRQPFFSTDFLLPATNTGNPPFIGTAISAGTIASNATLSTANHPGICRMTSSTTANGGYRWQTEGISGNLIGGGETFEIVFAPLNFTTTTFRAGYYDATTNADCVDGIYFEYATTGALVGKTANNSVRTTSATITTLALNTWYRGVIVVNNAATSVTFTVYDANGVSLGTQTVTTNIPTGAGRQTAVGCIATESSVTATAMVDLDYMAFNFGTTRPLLR